MSISPADAKFVRKMMKRNQIDYGQLLPSKWDAFTGSTIVENISRIAANPSVGDGSKQQSGPSTMASNHHGAANAGNKRTRGPHQDIASPSIIRVPPSKNGTQLPATSISTANLNQPTTSPISTRPTAQPPRIPPAPPAAPPLPSNFGSAPPMAPPLPVNFSPESLTSNQSSSGSPKPELPAPEAPKKPLIPSGQPASLMTAIVSFNAKVLKVSRKLHSRVGQLLRLCCEFLVANSRSTTKTKRATEEQQWYWTETHNGRPDPRDDSRATKSTQ